MSLPIPNSRVTDSRGCPWLINCEIWLPTRSTHPKRAYVMASSRLDLPEPVGPHSTNRSRSVKSISCSSRKDVKPLSLRWRGLIGSLGHFLVDLVEGGKELVRGTGAVNGRVVRNELALRV